MAEHILEGLVNAQGGSSSGVRVIIPPILFGNEGNGGQSHQQSLQQQVRMKYSVRYLIFIFLARISVQRSQANY
jgi:hypothetical protein